MILPRATHKLPPYEPDRDFTDQKNYVGPPNDRIYKQGPCQRCGCIIFGDKPEVHEFCDVCETQTGKGTNNRRTGEWSLFS